MRNVAEAPFATIAGEGLAGGGLPGGGLCEFIIAGEGLCETIIAGDARVYWTTSAAAVPPSTLRYQLRGNKGAAAQAKQQRPSAARHR